MKIVFISNALDHIQIPLCDALYNETNGNFIYVACTVSASIRSCITDKKINSSREYVLCPYEDIQQEKLAMQAIDNADAVILGCAPEKYIINRLKAKKITFRYMERLYKTPFNIKNIFHRLVGAWLHHTRFQKYPLYMLCAGAYVLSDHKLYNNYQGKCYSWGYFPKFIVESKTDLLCLKQQSDIINIIWVGRFISLKHPEQVINLANYLKERKLKFHITMIGYGELEEKSRQEILSLNLESSVSILSSLSPDEVRAYMKKSNILLFTSDRGDGWGAVVNEGMNSLCAVVASSAAGVSPYLIEHGLNGYLYDCNKQKSLNEKVEKLILNKNLREMLANAAYETISNYWNPEYAAKSLIKLINSLLSGEKLNLDIGPCSIAKLFKDGWFKE